MLFTAQYSEKLYTITDGRSCSICNMYIVAGINLCMYVCVCVCVCVCVYVCVCYGDIHKL